MGCNGTCTALQSYCCCVIAKLSQVELKLEFRALQGPVGGYFILPVARQYLNDNFVSVNTPIQEGLLLEERGGAGGGGGIWFVKMENLDPVQSKSYSTTAICCKLRAWTGAKIWPPSTRPLITGPNLTKRFSTYL